MNVLDRIQFYYLLNRPVPSVVAFYTTNQPDMATIFTPEIREAKSKFIDSRVCVIHLGLFETIIEKQKNRFSIDDVILMGNNRLIGVTKNRSVENLKILFEEVERKRTLYKSIPGRTKWDKERRSWLRNHVTQKYSQITKRISHYEYPQPIPKAVEVQSPLMTKQELPSKKLPPPYEIAVKSLTNHNPKIQKLNQISANLTQINYRCPEYTNNCIASSSGATNFQNMMYSDDLSSFRCYNNYLPTYEESIFHKFCVEKKAISDMSGFPILYMERPKAYSRKFQLNLEPNEKQNL